MFDDECRPFRDDKTPISDDEYARLLYVRKTGIYAPRGTAEWEQWLRIVCRFHDQYPTTIEREAWHEAGHVVVGHRLGWDAKRIERHADGHVFAEVLPPCPMPPLGLMDWATVKVAGYLSEHRATKERTDPTEEPAEISKFIVKARAQLGERTRSWDCINYVQQAEGRALEILNTYWREVQTVAELAVASLPVERAHIVDVLRTVPQLENPCDGSL